jgi:hypothetical protein
MTVGFATPAEQRAAAMIEFENGDLPSAENGLNGVIAEIASPATDAARHELAQSLIARATVRRFSNRSADALDDLSAAERVADQLPELLRRSVLVNVYTIRAKILAFPFSDVHDQANALIALRSLRNLGVSNWFVDELDSDLAYQSRDWRLAMRLALAAAERADEEGWTVAAWRLRRRAGEALLDLGDFDSAGRELEPARDFFAKWGPPDALAETCLALARLYSARGRHDQAWSQVLDALSGIEVLIRRFRLLTDQQRFLADKLRYYSQAFDIGLAKGGDAGVLRAWTIAERAKSFYLCQLVANGDVVLVDGIAASEVERLRALEDELDTLERAAAASTSAEAEAEIVAVSNEKHALLDRMMRENPRWAGLRAPPPFDLARELKSLDSAWTPVCYFWRPKHDGGEKLFLFHCDRGRIPQVATSTWTKEEVARLDAARAALRGRVPAPAVLVPSDLAAKLLPADFLAQLRDGQRLLVSPHGRLRTVPIHALEVGHGVRAIDRWPVQYLPTLALLAIAPRPRRGSAVLAMGSAHNAFGDATLKEIEGEIATVASTWATRRRRQVRHRLLSAAESPRRAGLSIETWHNFEYCHIACHGVFPEGRPLDASLRLGSDAVRASEFFGVRLGASLVVLSACSLGQQVEITGGVPLAGDEWVGLYAPLFYAGAEQLLVSAWDANSQVARRLMETLHTALSNGVSTVNAFQLAVREVRAKPPALWGNWYLVGIPTSQRKEVGTMEDVFEIELPASATEEDAAALEDALKQLDEVEDAGSTESRGIDPGMVSLWVQAVSGSLGVIGTAVPIIRKVLGVIRGRGVRGARLKLADGTEISVDEASEADLERLIRAAKES